MTYTLFRLKIVRSEARTLHYDRDEAAATILLSAIREKPEAILRKGQRWRIGNIAVPEEGFVTFNLGKITRKTQTLFNEATGDFMTLDLDLARIRTSRWT